MIESKTPRTDAEFLDDDGLHLVGTLLQAVGLCRRLERELAQAVRERDEARACLREAMEHAQDHTWFLDINEHRAEWARWRKALGEG